MLSRIELKNFVLFPSLELDFLPGTTAITGETGAGKSIILDAIELALGGRLTTHVIYEGASKCDISVYFDIATHEAAKQWLSAHELTHEENACILTRVITSEGRSRGYINGQPCSLQILTELGDLLISIHGQHQHQKLMKREYQRELLDAYAGHINLSEEVKKLAQTWHALHKEKQAIQVYKQKENNQTEFLQYQLEEFVKLALQEGEIESLEQEHKQLANAELIISHCKLALARLHENEEGAILSSLHQVMRTLEEIKEVETQLQQLQNICSLLHETSIQLDEATLQLRRYLEIIHVNPERFEWVEQRLTAIHHLSRKHKVAPQALISLQKQIEQELMYLASAQERENELDKQLQTIEKEYYKQAEKLRMSRQTAAQNLSKLVTENIHHLGIAAGIFVIDFRNQDNPQPNPTGLDNIEFLISTNLGTPLQPINKIASGGELSRISLVIQVVTASEITTPTLIFDEVDVGIGGKTADIVGRLLRKLGKCAQIFCVTHLPQVAVQAHQHLYIEKRQTSHETIVEVSYLSREQRVSEIARMLGGLEITSQTTAHASEMLANVNE